ncbi:MAG: hypothetical protein KGR98_06635, partial [Verrucomicrobia bacterium]|nr:hypothetical protein [Verrucomicrobiota bacterium]
AARTLAFFARRLREFPQAMPFMLQALDFSLQEPARIVIAGDARSPEAGALARAAQSVYRPNKVVLGNAGAVEPFARTLPARGAALAYLCSGNACQPPVSEPDGLAALLAGSVR